MKYLQHDDAVVCITEREELQEYLNFRKENDYWAIPMAKECSTVGINDMPMFFEQYRNEYKINVSDEILEETANGDTKLLLVYPYENSYQVEPLRYTAFSDVCKRAGLEGRTMDLMNPKGNYTPIDPMLRGQYLSTGLSLSEEYCKVLYRDEKITAMKSNRYVIFPEHELISKLEVYLKDEWQDYQFMSAVVCHEYLVVNYLLSNPELEKTFKLELEDLGIFYESVKVGITFKTSDVGASCVTILPYCIVNGTQEIMLGSSLKLKHENGSSMENFEEMLYKIAASLQEAEDRIEQLGNLPLQYPVSCFMKVCDAYKLPITLAKEMEDEITQEYVVGKSATAIDIFLKLNDLVYRYSQKENDAMKVIILKENVSKLMFIDFEKFDTPLIILDK